MAASEESELIANESALEAFCKAPAEQRQLTAELKGVLAETACTGEQQQRLLHSSIIATLARSRDP